MEREIRYCTTEDGVRIAYCVEGEGAPLLWCPIFLEAFTIADRHPAYRRLMAELSRRWMVVRYDARGTGLSDREATDFSGAALAMDIAAVATASGLEPLAIWGNTLSGPRAIACASLYPGSVSRLVLYDTFPRPNDSLPIAAANALSDLARSNWKLATQAVAGLVFSSIDDPALSQLLAGESVAMASVYEQSTDGHTAAAIGEEMFKSWDVTEVLPGVSCPVLVAHHLDNPRVALDVARTMATGFPDATLITLEGAFSSILTDALVRGGGPILPAIAGFLGAAEEKVSRPAPSGLVTVLFTDIEGSTSLTQSLGDSKAQEYLRAHDAIVRNAVGTHGGSEIKHTGDGIMASFPLASGALGCAVSIQRAIDDRTSEDGEFPLRVRIGLNAGEPVAEDEDLFGTAVQLAARICAQAKPGQILASNVVRELSAGKGFHFTGQRDVALKGFEDPVPLCEVTWRQSEAGGAPPLTEDPSVSLTARETEVLSLLASGRSGKEIAAELSVSLSTVQRHISNIYAKIGVRGRVEAAAYAIERGLVRPRND